MYIISKTMHTITQTLSLHLMMLKYLSLRHWINIQISYLDFYCHFTLLIYFEHDNIFDVLISLCIWVNVIE